MRLLALGLIAVTLTGQYGHRKTPLFPSKRPAVACTKGAVTKVYGKICTTLGKKITQLTNSYTITPALAVRIKRSYGVQIPAGSRIKFTEKIREVRQTQDVDMYIEIGGQWHYNGSRQCMRMGVQTISLTPVYAAPVLGYGKSRAQYSSWVACDK